MKPSARKRLSDERIAASVFLWPQALELLIKLVEDEEVTITGVAGELGMTHSALGRIVSGETANPHARTRMAIIDWVEGYLRSNPDAEENIGGSDENSDMAGADQKSPEEDLLDYFLEHSPQMATFLSTTTEGLNAEDRRRVALAIFNGFKRLAIEAGERLPDWFFELERRFVQGAE